MSKHKDPLQFSQYIYIAYSHSSHSHYWDISHIDRQHYYQCIVNKPSVLYYILRYIRSSVRFTYQLIWIVQKLTDLVITTSVILVKLIYRDS